MIEDGVVYLQYDSMRKSEEQRCCYCYYCHCRCQCSLASDSSFVLELDELAIADSCRSVGLQKMLRDGLPQRKAGTR